MCQSVCLHNCYLCPVLYWEPLNQFLVVDGRVYQLLCQYTQGLRSASMANFEIQETDYLSLRRPIVENKTNYNL